MRSCPNELHEKQVARYFNTVASAWASRYSDESRIMRWIDKRIRSDVFSAFKVVFEEITHSSGNTLLDVGCGVGHYSVEAARHGYIRVVGLDMADEMIKHARALAKRWGVSGDCEFIVGTFPQERPSEMFDHTIAIGVMDYVVDALSFVRNLQKYTRVSTMISFPSVHWLRTPARKARYKFLGCPVRFYTHEAVEGTLDEAGFADINIIKLPGFGGDYLAIGR